MKVYKTFFLLLGSLCIIPSAIAVDSTDKEGVQDIRNALAQDLARGVSVDGLSILRYRSNKKESVISFCSESIILDGEIQAGIRELAKTYSKYRQRELIQRMRKGEWMNNIGTYHLELTFYFSGSQMAGSRMFTLSAVTEKEIAKIEIEVSNMISPKKWKRAK